MTRFAVVVVLAACGAPSKPAEPAKPLVWKDMNLEQRTNYMKEVVLPTAKDAFVAFDKKYETMDCMTCHGDGAKDGSFEMPNAKLKPLPNTEEAFMAWVAKEPEAARYAEFMATKLQPLMGQLLNETVYDPQTKTGELGCSTCHTLVDASGAIVEPAH
ncbi:MAG: hypothetical protein AB7T06_04440 [Kofleriaceae bacterium]